LRFLVPEVQVVAVTADRSSARKLGVPIYQLLGGKVRDKIKVYAWIGGDRPSDVEAQAYAQVLPALPYRRPGVWRS